MSATYEYVGVIASTHKPTPAYRCPHCGASVVDIALHESWHAMHESIARAIARFVGQELEEKNA